MKPKPIKAVILAGGKGTRLAPYTTVLPKPLMPVGDMPILEVVIRQLKHFGVTDLTIAVGHLAELLEAFFGDGSKFGVSIKYSREDAPLGTAGPLALVDGLDDTFLAMNGDLLTTINYGEFLKYHKEHGALATLGMHKRKVTIDLGVLVASDSMEVEQYIEKPTYNYHVSMGIYAFEPRVMQFIPKNSRLDFPDLVRNLMAHGEKVVAYPCDEFWLDIGRHDDYEQAVQQFDKHRKRFLWEEKAK